MDLNQWQGIDLDRKKKHNLFINQAIECQFVHLPLNLKLFLLGIRSFVIMRSEQSIFILAVLIFGKDSLFHTCKIIQVINTSTTFVYKIINMTTVV
jgi:hypothetical protein